MADRIRGVGGGGGGGGGGGDGIMVSMNMVNWVKEIKKKHFYHLFCSLLAYMFCTES